MTAESFTNWRLNLGLSQKDAAAELGCSLRSITNWETGVFRIPKYMEYACAWVEQKLKAK